MISCKILDNLDKHISIINPPIIEGTSGIKHQFYLIGRNKEDLIVIEYCKDEISLLKFFIKSSDVKSKLKIAIYENITEEVKKLASSYGIFLAKNTEDIIKIIKENL
ncbi:MAG: hypothetical protein DSO09_05045 [Candidatus Methanomethylicota archaeon]|jgi:hypothetical protein|uniref:Uncharacterized protein n=1 Tax=Thermoproteota archaeon TaxID=2056631 RepID=A0A523BBB6_9CREN|nr:MAG: hypothetical protein EF809_04495 [Candidatus Verstraetearchaeota archaeon]TDA38152.1 MAG: hypothetical protein DSO09_05045 [Candidatus Verstraetearchaeota archaeon]